jgi:hypothetical protein
MLRHNFLTATLGVLVTLTVLTSPPFLDVASAQVTKNVIIIMTDDQNVDSLPVMRKLMSYPEGSWVNFTHAIANDSICCPARATILTGQYAHVTGVTSNSNGYLLNDANTLPVWLDSAGYRTGLISKYLNGFPWDKGADYIPPGWDPFGHRELASPICGQPSSLISSTPPPVHSSCTWHILSRTL